MNKPLEASSNEGRIARKPKQWSLGRRMRTWFALASLGVFILCYLFGVSFIGKAYQDVVLTTLREEEEEFSVMYEASDRTQDQALGIYEDLSHRHPELRLAFWVWDTGTQSQVCLVGDPTLIHNHPMGYPNQFGAHFIGGKIYSRFRESKSGFTFGVVMDAANLNEVLQRFHTYAAILALAAVAVGLLLGDLFSRLMSHQLTRISEAVKRIHIYQEARELDLDLDLDGSPQEIHSVVQSLSDMLSTIREENQASDLTIAGLAHELGAPVQNMLGETEVLMMGSPRKEDYQKLVEVYQDELHQLSDAVHNLVTLCASRGGKVVDWETEEFDLAREAGFRLLREQASAGKREVLLEIDYRGDMLMVADKESILRALRNLVSNAIAWSPVCEVVFVVMDGSNPDELSITVDDAGPGVPEAERDKIFEMLYRGADAGGRRVGYGLGLALAHQAITNHGGSITVGDSPLGGARFSVTLPRHGAGPSSSS